jgi:carboxylesterase type B
LTINIVRPSGVKAGDELPVGLWVHGGVSSRPIYPTLYYD